MTSVDLAPRTGPDDTRPVLVLIPGLLNDADLWRDQSRALSAVARVVVADITGRETMRGLAEAVLALTDGPFALAGFSLGGYVAQDVLRIAPERVERLALLDTNFRPDTPERAIHRRMISTNAGLPGRFHGFGTRLLATYLHPDHRGDRRWTDRVRAMTERLGSEILIRQNGLERIDGTDVLSRLRCPVLVLCGDHDEITPVSGHREMAALIPQARLVIVPGSGHLAPIEQPELVTEALQTWLSSA